MKVSSASAGDGSSASPAGKKLKQARLPFQIISGDAAKTLTAPLKKRKLSGECEESPSKIGKQSVNPVDEIVPEKPVDSVMVISDDEDSVKSDVVESPGDLISSKVLNPLVSLVDIALKRKLNKKSTPVKKKQKKTNKKSKNDVEDISENNVEENNTANNPSISDDKNEIVIIDDDSNAEPGVSEEKCKSADRIENKENIHDIAEVEELSDKIVHVEELSDKLVQVEELSDSNKIEPSETDCPANSQSEELSNKGDETECDEKQDDIEKNEQSENECSSNQEDDSSSECSKNEECKTGDEASGSKSPERKKKDMPSEEFITPKSHKKEQSDSDSLKDNSSSEKSRRSPRTPSVDSKKLTPKQAQKRLESMKRQQEREKEKQEKERKRQEEKDEKNRQRLEKEEQKKKEREEKEEQKKKEREEKERLKDQEKKEREEKEEAKRKDREEKELQKKREKEAKEEERRKKEIEREEEKRRKEIEKEEQESKKKKASAFFVNFFVPKDRASSSKVSDDTHHEDVVKNDYLSNFTKKSDMRLAPLRRRHLDIERKNTLEEHLVKQEVDKDEMYFTMLKSKDYYSGTSKKTWPLEDVDNDVIIIEDDLSIDSMNIVLDSHKQTLKPKLLSFSENRRPPYWGTWRRTSKHITGRRPFGVDSDILDYDCDSDEEWEEEEPGESVGGSVAGSDDEEGENDYDVDNEFMVPHGYLSEEEAMGEEDEQILSPEIQKAKLKILQCEFENEMKKSTERLHPRLLGILWQKSDGSKPDSSSDTLWNFISNRKVLCAEEQIFIQPAPLNSCCEPDDAKNGDKPKKTRKIQEYMIPNLVRLVHGNTNSRGFLAHEFQTFIAKASEEGEVQTTEPEGEKASKKIDVSKMSIAKKIKEISKWMSCPEEGAMHGKTCWFVTKDVREKYSVEVGLPNAWSYALTPKRRSEVLKKDITKEKRKSAKKNISLENCFFKTKPR